MFFLQKLTEISWIPLFEGMLCKLTLKVRVCIAELEWHLGRTLFSCSLMSIKQMHGILLILILMLAPSINSFSYVCCRNIKSQACFFFFYTYSNSFVPPPQNCIMPDRSHATNHVTNVSRCLNAKSYCPCDKPWLVLCEVAYSAGQYLGEWLYGKTRCAFPQRVLRQMVESIYYLFWTNFNQKIIVFFSQEQ